MGRDGFSQAQKASGPHVAVKCALIFSAGRHEAEDRKYAIFHPGKFQLEQSSSSARSRSYYAAKEAI